MNQEGYTDKTAEEAIRNYNRLPRHMKEAIRYLNGIAELLGFEIVTMRDKKTKRVINL